MKIGPRTLGPSILEIAIPKALPVHMRGKIRELHGVWTSAPSRGDGHATALMLRTTAEADADRTMLMLCVEPEEGIDKARLARFYQKHGFQPVQADPLLMVRPVGGLQ